MLEDFKNAFQRYNNGHVQLIIINVIIFVILAVFLVVTRLSGLDSFFNAVHEQFAIPAKFSEYVTRPWTIITYMFSHDLGAFLHILFNMLMLYWFGRLFVEYLGSDKLIALYLLGGIVAGALFMLAYNFVPFYMDRVAAAEQRGIQMGLLGASGAINAIVVATAVLLPNYTFFLLFLGPVKVKYIAIAVVFLSFLGSVQSNAGGNVAHLGGALMGFIYMKQLQSGINWGGWITTTLYWFKDLFKPRPRVKVSYRNEAAGPKKPGAKSNVSQDELDAILDKISAGGYESLTKEEKEKLFNASKK